MRWIAIVRIIFLFCFQQSRCIDSNSTDEEVATDECAQRQWMLWGDWGPCDANCGFATKFRMRECGFIGGLQGKKDCGAESFENCMGDDLQEIICQGLPPCRAVSYWGEWSECSVTCQGENGIRERILVTENAGGTITLSGNKSQEDACTGSGAICPGWGAWSECSNPCGSPFGTRQRLYIDAIPEGTIILNPENVEVEPCQGNVTDCEETTESAVVTTTKPATTTSKCAAVRWSDWTEWSVCSVSCGQGTRIRTRKCENPDPSLCLDKCPGTAIQEEPCETNVRCCVPRQWTIWGPWGPCTSRCADHKGTRNRQRSCQYFGGKDREMCDEPMEVSCPTENYQIESCHDLPPCKPDNEWTSWTECTAACKGEVGVKGRVLLFRSQYGYYATNGTYTELTACTVDGPPCKGAYNPFGDEKKPCIPVNGGWTKWGDPSPCSTTCGIGFTVRSRECSNPPPNECGITCQGFSHSETPCQEKPCRICDQRQWTPWKKWSPCSATCGNGTRTRERSCDFIGERKGKDCGEKSSRKCKGEKFQEEICEGLPECTLVSENSSSADNTSLDNEEKSLCEIVDWSTWNPWTSCSRTCGSGVQTRTRHCLNVTTEWCLENCLTFSTEERACGIQPCQLECATRSWGPWGEWGPCDAKCGNTFRIRTKHCELPQNMDGKRDCGYDDYDENCMGDDIQEELCYGMPPCDSLAYWAEWGKCSVKCKGEIGFRERYTLTEETSGYVSLTPSLNQIESCTGTKTDCGAWTKWTSWSGCSCKTGKRTRTRQCVRPLVYARLKTVLDPKNCEGSGHESIRCLTSKICPECITSCQYNPEGEYPSCNSCSEYIRCAKNPEEHVVETCIELNTEWDALAKSCVPSPSPTCSLHECTSHCVGKGDGIYQACYACNAFLSCKRGRFSRHYCHGRMEFDYRALSCVYHRASTCKRRLSNIKRGPSFLARELEIERLRKERFLEVSKKRVVRPTPSKGDKATDKKGKKTTSKDRKNKDRKKKDKKTKRRRKNKKNDRVKTKVPGCVTGCRNLPRGRYPSCRSCKHYWQCHPKKSRQKKCAKKRNWDNRAQKCLAVSSTCPGK